MALASKLQSEIGGPILASHHDDQTNDIRTLSSNLNTVTASLGSYASINHTHEISGVNGLGAALATKLNAASNLSDLQSAKQARANLGIDKYTPVGDADYTVLSSDKVVGISAPYTKPHTWTLPLANTVNAGQTIRLIDFLGTISSSNTLTLICAGSDALNNAATIIFGFPNLDLLLTSDGVSRWAYGVVDISRGGTGATTVTNARNNLGVPAILNGTHKGTTQFDTIYSGALPNQFPLTANFMDSTHSTSRRVTVNVGSNWQILQDTAGNGTKDFSLYNVGTGGVVYTVDPTSNTIYPGADNTINLGNANNRFGAMVARAHVARDATAPMHTFHNTSGATDSKIWDQTATTTALNFRLANDALSSYTTWLTATRSTMSVSSVSVGGTSFGPITDNASTLGSSSFRWSTIYAASATINTSDANQKSPFRAYSTAELDAIGDVLHSGGMFKWLSAVEEKGYDQARIHCGYTAQALRNALLERNLNPDDYAAFCCDPVTRVVQKTRKVQRQVVEERTTTSLQIVIEDGQPIQKKITTTDKVPVFEQKAVIDEQGNVVLASRREEGSPDLPLYYSVPVMETIDETYNEVEVVDGKLQLGLRYDLVTAWAIAYLLRENHRLRMDMKAIGTSNEEDNVL